MIYESGVYLHHSSILFSPILDGKVTIFSLAISSIRIKALLLLLSFSVMFNSLWPYGLHGCQASLSFTISWNLLKLMSIESVMPSNHLVLYRSLLLLPSIFPRIRVFSNEQALHIRWPKYLSLSLSISLSNEYSGLISFRIDWFDVPAVQGTLKGLLQHQSSKASVLGCSVFIIQLSHLYMTTEKNHSFDYMNLCWQSDVSAF